VLNFESPVDGLSISKDRVAANLARSDSEGTHKWNTSVRVDISFKR
jgi:hypothetical protein